MEELLHILLTPNKEHKTAFPNIPIIGFRNGKSLKDFLVRATLPILNDSGRCESCGKELVWSVILEVLLRTLQQKDTFKIHTGLLNCDSGKVLYLLVKRKFCV